MKKQVYIHFVTIFHFCYNDEDLSNGPWNFSTKSNTLDKGFHFSIKKMIFFFK